MAFDGAQATVQFGVQEGGLRRSAPIAQCRALGGRGTTCIDQLLQAQQRLGWRRQGGRFECLAHQCQQPGIYPVGLGEVAAGLGEQPRPQRINDRHGQACRMQRTVHGPMVLAGRFHHRSAYPEPGQIAFQPPPAAGVVADAELHCTGRHIDVQPLFTHIDAGIDCLHRVRFGRYLALHAGLAPHHLFRTSARTDGPSSSPVLAKGRTVPPVRSGADGHPPRIAATFAQALQIQHARGVPSRSPAISIAPCCGFCARPKPRRGGWSSSPQGASSSRSRPCVRAGRRGGTHSPPLRRHLVPTPLPLKGPRMGAKPAGSASDFSIRRGVSATRV